MRPFGFYDAGRWRTKFEWRTFIALVTILVVTNIGYRWLAMPPEYEWGPLSFVMNPETVDTISSYWDTNFWRLFLPIDMGGNRYSWSPIMIITATFLWNTFSPATVYFIFTSLHVASFATVAYTFTRSLLFTAVLGFMVSLSTSLNYGMVYGMASTIHLFLAFAAITAFVSIRYLTHASTSYKWVAGLVLSWIFLALCFEFWVNLAIPTILSAILIHVWARRTDHADLRKRSAIVALSVFGVLLVYIAARLQFAGQHVMHGHENEMVFSYDHLLLAVEDMFINYLTYLHMVITSIFPGFLSFSPSYTYIGPETILAGQNGYHSLKTDLVIFSHLTSWRFLAGAYCVGFLMLSYRILISAFSSRSANALIPLVFVIIVLAGFVTYIPIKMRPMHLTAMLGYKAIISSSGFLILIAWLFYTAPAWAKSEFIRKAFIIILPCFVVLAAFTRPAVERAGLEAVGLDSVSDPFWWLGDPAPEPVQEPAQEPASGPAQEPNP